MLESKSLLRWLENGGRSGEAEVEQGFYEKNWVPRMFVDGGPTSYATARISLSDPVSMCCSASL